MPLLQSVEGCLEAGIGASGLSQAELARYLDRLQPRLDSLREAYATGDCEPNKLLLHSINYRRKT